MPWPVTINGKTYNESDFSPYGYVTALPAILSDLAAVAAGIAAAATGLVLGTLAVSGANASSTIYDTTNYAAGVGGIEYFDFKNASGTQRHGASIRTDATTGTNAAEVADLILSTMRAGTLTDAWKITGSGTLAPTTDDGAAIGSATHTISDVFLASGGVINWNNGNFTATHVNSVSGLSFSGNVGFGSAAMGGASGHFRINQNITGASSSSSVINTATSQSDVTGTASWFATSGSTAAASYTLTNLFHFTANQSTIGAGSTVTNQMGFRVSSTLTGAANNYGFYSDIAAASGRWNFYAAGTAQNYFAGITTFAASTASTSTTTGAAVITGGLGVGDAIWAGGGLALGSPATLAAHTIRSALAMTGSTTVIGVRMTGVIQSDVTANATYFRTDVSTLAASFTLTDLIHYDAVQGTIGAGSSVTNQYAFRARNFSGATNNYGVYSELSAGSGKWNIYCAGTATNYFAGDIRAVGSYANTSGSAANVFIDTDGTLKRSTSSIQYKDDVKDYARSMADIMTLRPVSFLPKNDGDRRFAGFISEELHDRGFTEFVDYDADGKPSGIHYGHMTALCVAGLQDHEARIAQLESRSIH